MIPLEILLSTSTSQQPILCTTHSILLSRRIETMKQSQFQSKKIQHLIIFSQWKEAHLDQRP